ncbi:hypothetical protein HO133_005289 [Letharia lupina]|uniref:Uncharacterized protein n=1 Tax=Letharia lupina TaxID=560253 RepID=A0A8H6C865_9LECA|nr:uncharacterized protein HO133_005289 [Letharia lupina]KAF6218747.1 hypothetical protein HO133_005289 [Letharia lupina]
MLTNAIHFNDFDPKSVRFKVAEAGTVVVVRYEPEGRNDGDREQVKEYIMKEYGCTARKDGTANEKAHDYTFLNPEEKKAGFLVFDFPVHEEAYRCQKELDGKKAYVEFSLT